MTARRTCSRSRGIPISATSSSSTLPGMSCPRMTPGARLARNHGRDRRRSSTSSESSLVRETFCRFGRVASCAMASLRPETTSCLVTGGPDASPPTRSSFLPACGISSATIEASRPTAGILVRSQPIGSLERLSSDARPTIQVLRIWLALASSSQRYCTRKPTANRFSLCPALALTEDENAVARAYLVDQDERPRLVPCRQLGHLAGGWRHLSSRAAPPADAGRRVPV